MNIRINEDGLPIATIDLESNGKKITLENVLVDTGCAVTIMDTDLLGEVGIIIDFKNGIPTTMYGVGGKGEVCYQQKVTGLAIDGQQLKNFDLQFGMVQDMYGFDGLIGTDFMLKTGLSINFSELKVEYHNRK
jgi:hypothetical protein